MQKIIITSKKRIKEIKNFLLKKKTYILGIKIATFNEIFLNFLKNKEKSEIHIYNLLTKFKHFKNIIQHPILLKKIISFYKKLKLIKINIKKIKINTKFEKKIIKIIKILNKKIFITNIKKNKNKKIYYYDKNGVSFEEEIFLKNNNIKSFKFKKIKNPKYILNYYSENTKTEIESIAQNISKYHKKNIKIAIFLPNFYEILHFIEPIFKYYKIPFLKFNYKKKFQIKQFLSLIKIFYFKNNEKKNS